MGKQYVARSTGTVRINRVRYNYTQGDVLPDGHPLVLQRPSHFRAIATPELPIPFEIAPEAIVVGPSEPDALEEAGFAIVDPIGDPEPLPVEEEEKPKRSHSRKPKNDEP